MSFDGVLPRPSGNRPERDRHDDDVIGVAQYGHEIRDQIDRREQLREQEKQADTHASGHVRVGSQPPQQPNEIGKQPQRIAHRYRAGVEAA